MVFGESNGHVTDNVTWPWKVKVVTELSLLPNISKRARDRGLVTMEDEYEMEYVESNGHVTDYITWPRKVTIVTSLSLGPNISKRARDSGLVTMGHESEMGMGSPMVTWPMTSRDLEGSGRDSKMFGAHYLTWPITSGDLKMSRSWARYI